MLEVDIADRVLQIVLLSSVGTNTRYEGCFSSWDVFGVSFHARFNLCIEEGYGLRTGILSILGSHHTR